MVVLGLLVLPALAFAQVEKAEKALRELEYPEALKALEVARKQPGNDRATTLRIYELQGVVLATMGKEAQALKAFQALFSLVPDFKLSGNHPPRVTTVFYEARGWLDQHQAIAARQLPAKTQDGLVKQLQVELANDPLKLVKEIRFGVLADGKTTEVDVPVTGQLITVPQSVQRLSWWAVLLGEKKAQLKELSSASSPRIEAAAPLPVAVKPKEEPKPELKPQPKPEPVAEAKPEKTPEKNADAEKSTEKDADKITEKSAEKTGELTEWSEPPPPATPMSGKRIASIALLGGGAVAAGVGVAFGVISNGTRAQVTSAETDSAGRVIGLTQKDALALDAQQRTQATVANVLMISGAALAAGGVTLLILSLGDTQVALVPAAGGVSVAGSF